MKEKLQTILNKIKPVLTNNKTIIGVILFTIIMLIIIFISISIINKGTVPTLRSSNWDDFKIYIEGNTITLGSKINTLDKTGFTLKNYEYENTKLEPKYQTSGIVYAYKENKDKYNEVYFSAYNNSSNPKSFKDSILNGLEINQHFYKNFEVILPKGLILDQNLTKDILIKKWKKPSSQDKSLMEWKNDKGTIKVYINEDNTIFSIIYTLNI